MTESKVIEQMIEHLEGIFPKTCPNCQRCYETLPDYLSNTERIGKTFAYDLEMGDLNPLNPVGTVAAANCRCGSTLTLTSDGMPLLRLWSLLHWAKGETRRRGITSMELLNHLCDELCKKVLSEAGGSLDSLQK